MNYVFGPVPSRRLGRSLGIDTVPPKTCNWNCVYCQLGRTHPLTNELREFFPLEAILAELRARLAVLDPAAFDWITFVSSGEGTLHCRFGELLRAVKRINPRPVAVITNGSLLDLPSMREDLAFADAVMPTLDAGDEAMFRKINRPHRGLTFDRHVAGIEAFARMEKRGRLWIEVMLIAGLNDTDVELRKMAALLSHIQPDEIHLTVPARCPVEPWVHPPDAEAMRRAQGILGALASFAPPPQVASLSRDEMPDIASIVNRHPLRLTDLAGLFPEGSQDRIAALVADLLSSGRVKIVERAENRFLVGADLRYPRQGSQSPQSPVDRLPTVVSHTGVASQQGTVSEGIRLD